MASKTKTNRLQPHGPGPTGRMKTRPSVRARVKSPKMTVRAKALATSVRMPDELPLVEEFEPVEIPERV